MHELNISIFFIKVISIRVVICIYLRIHIVVKKYFSQTITHIHMRKLLKRDDKRVSILSMSCMIFHVKIFMNVD